MLVRDAMTTHVITVGMDTTMEEVRCIFEAATFHHLLVTEEQRVVGVISDRDLLKNVSPFLGKLAERTQDLAMLKKKVHQVMTRTLWTTTPEMSLVQAGRIMFRKRFSCLPVVDDCMRPEGILTIRDVARVAIEILDEAGLDEAA